MIINVTNSGSGAYIIDGVSNPTLTVIRGRTYTFQIDAVGHPFRLQTVAAPYNSSSEYVYAQGGVQTGSVEFSVFSSTELDLAGDLKTPNTLYYVCQNHSSMSGVINVVEEGSATEASVSTISLHLTVETPSISLESYGAEISAPRKSLQITGQAPYILRACVLVPPVPEPEPEPEDVISTPTPLGVTYENLPVIDTVTQIIDTSPDEIIGCANVLISGSEQGILNALFPAASNGDGVVNRGNNDIWTYNGSIWTNVGPTPGRQLIVTQVVPPYDEIEVVTGLIRVRSSVEAINYSLAPITVQPRMVVKVRTTVIAGPALYVPSSLAFTLEPVAPSIEIRDAGQILGVTFGKCAYVVDYRGSGLNTSKSLPTPFPANMVFFFKKDTLSNRTYTKPWFDIPRGGNSYWSLDTSKDISKPGMLQFNDSNIFISSSNVNEDSQLLNQLNVDYRAYIFLGSRTGVTNNDGAITSTVYNGPAFSIISYIGTGATTTVGHGLGAEPEVMFFREVSPIYSGDPYATVFAMAGRYIGRDYQVFPSGSVANNGFRDSIDDGLIGYDSSVFTVGSNSYYNEIGSQIISYAFKSVEGVCKIGEFYGNQLPTGKFIDCGFKVNMVMIKTVVEGAANSSSAALCIIDSSTSTDAPIYDWDGGDQASSSPRYEFTETGFRIYEAPVTGTNYQTLNKLGVKYVFIAFAEFIFTKITCQPVNFSNQKWPPSVSTGMIITVPVPMAYNLTGVEPSYIGADLYALSPPVVNISIQALAPVIGAGVRIALDAVDFSFRKTSIGYVGEASQEGREYIAIVEYRDGSPLERSLQACVHRLVRDLKAKSLLDKCITIVPMCLAKTITGATTPLIGRYPTIADRPQGQPYGSPSTWLDYDRRTGARPYRFDSGSFTETNVDPQEVEPQDSHMAVYITEQNTAGNVPGEFVNGFQATFGGELLGVNYTAQEFTMFRANGGFANESGAGPGFVMCNWGNSVTGRHLTEEPHWSEPSLVGMSRNAAENYTVRVAKTNRNVLTFPPGEDNVAIDIGIFRYGNAYYNGLMGDFRIPFYTIGKAVDLAELETVIETFLAQVAAALSNATITVAAAAALEIASFAPGIQLTTIIFVPTVPLNIEAFGPNSVGVPAVVIKPESIVVELLPLQPSIYAIPFLVLGADLGIALSMAGGIASAIPLTIEEMVSVGTVAPLLGREPATASDGWTLVQDATVNTGNILISGWPFTFTIDSLPFTGCYVSANTYITFGAGYNPSTGLSPSSPPYPKIYFGAANNTYDRLYTQTTTINGKLAQRIRYEGTAASSGEPGASNIIAEFTFFEAFSDGRQLIEVRFGIHGRGLFNSQWPFYMAGVSQFYGGFFEWTEEVPYYLARQDTSWALIGNSTGTAWTLTDNRYVAP